MQTVPYPQLQHTIVHGCTHSFARAYATELVHSRMPKLPVLSCFGTEAVARVSLNSRLKQRLLTECVARRGSMCCPWMALTVTWSLYTEAKNGSVCASLGARARQS